MQSLRAPPAAVLESLSYVSSSGQRENVLTAVVPGPKTPAQVARYTAMRLPHVSRAISQLVRVGLIRLVAGERRGKLYAPTDLGRAVFQALAEARGDRLIVPLARGTHFRSYHHWISVQHGRAKADEILAAAGIDPARFDPNGWYPLRAVIRALELIEARFGDGTYDVIRRMMRDEAKNYPSIKRLTSLLIPFPMLLELTPNAYNREFNHGRLEVEIESGRALMKNYDWITSPARCAAWLGTYEGGVDLIGKKATVRKVACMIRGDPYCGYQIEW